MHGITFVLVQSDHINVHKSEFYALPRLRRFRNLAAAHPRDQLKTAASASIPLRDPDEWAKMFGDYSLDVIMLYTVASEKYF